MMVSSTSLTGPVTSYNKCSLRVVGGSEYMGRNGTFLENSPVSWHFFTPRDA